MQKITCPYCLTDSFRPAKSCDACSAQITYGNIPQDTLGFIAIGAMICSLVAMNVIPRFGIRHPFIAFFVTIFLVSFLGIWRASNLYRDAVSWKQVTLQKDGDEHGLEWRRMPFDLKLRYEFELYHRQRYGYYPTWDAEESRFAVRSARDKWMLWELFFQSRRNQVIAISSAVDMAALYLNAIGSKYGNVAELVE